MWKSLELWTLIVHVITAVGLGVTIFYAAKQLKAARTVNSQAHDWNRRKAAQDICCRYDELNPEKSELLERLRFFSDDGVITREDINGIFEENPELRLICHKLLNYFEYLCVGIKQGVYDEDVVREFWSAVMVRVFSWLKPYIEQYRGEPTSSGSTWILMEEYLNKWNHEKLTRPSRGAVDKLVGPENT